MTTAHADSANDPEGFIRVLVERSRIAQEQIADYTQEQVDALITRAMSMKPN